MPPNPAPPTPETGLTHAAARAALASHGPNDLPGRRAGGLVATLAGIVREPMFLLLAACGATYLLLGDTGEAAMLIGFVLVVVTISVVQARRTEHALEALRNLASPRARVLRDGVPVRIPGREVVPGDLVLLAEGDRVPADGVLLRATALRVDESLLTGESVPVSKCATTTPRNVAATPGGEGQPWVFSGTLVVQGSGTARVIATGSGTAMGRIGRALSALAAPPTRLERETTRVVKQVAWIGLVLAALVATWYAIARGDALNGVLAGITLAMAILPEEVPVVLTLFLGLGAYRIARRQVLTRRIPAVETLGAATVLCVDKTGTLTANRMQVARLRAHGESFDPAKPHGPLPESLHALLEHAVLASQRDPHDPMEQAIRAAGERLLAGTEHLREDWTLAEHYPLSPELLAMSQVWRSPDGERLMIAAKGAPEAIADLCHLDAARAAELAAEVERMARAGLRVLAVARASFAGRVLPAIQHDFPFELAGLLGLADPLRAGVAEAVDECRQAGIRVLMITGDHPATALAIARAAGLRADRAVTGSELAATAPAGLARLLAESDVFCRVSPEQKLVLVEALRARGEVVAMTGDGVNDAPALKAADIGIAMGGRGADVAREAADLVLLDDDFASIVAAVRLGRRIFDNLRKAIAFVVAVHVPIVGMSVLPVLAGWPVVLMPVHVLFLQLIIDPACSIVFEAEREEDDLMRRPPRARDARLFDPALLQRAALQGLLLLVIVLAIFATALARGHAPDDARALTFTTLVMANLGLILTHRTRAPIGLPAGGGANPALWWVVGGAVVLLTAVHGIAEVRALFSFSALHADDLVLCLAAALASFVLCEATKRLGRDRLGGSG